MLSVAWYIMCRVCIVCSVVVGCVVYWVPRYVFMWCIVWHVVVLCDTRGGNALSISVAQSPEFWLTGEVLHDVLWSAA